MCALTRNNCFSTYFNFCRSILISVLNPSISMFRRRSNSLKRSLDRLSRWPIFSDRSWNRESRSPITSGGRQNEPCRSLASHRLPLESCTVALPTRELDFGTFRRACAFARAVARANESRPRTSFSRPRSTRSLAGAVTRPTTCSADGWTC